MLIQSLCEDKRKPKSMNMDYKCISFSNIMISALMIHL